MTVNNIRMIKTTKSDQNIGLILGVRKNLSVIEFGFDT